MGNLVVFKGIKPSRLKDDALRLALLNAMRREATAIKKDFDATVKTWDHSVKFEQVISLAGGGPQVLVGTDDEVYRYVDEGTKPHDIVPKKPGGILVFPGTFTSKTVPGVIGSRAGYKGGEIIKRPRVHHPGTKARRFTEIIKGKWEKRFKSDMEDVMKAAARDSGHGVK